MEIKEYTYEIDGKTYIQRPLVLGQLSQMIGALEGIEIPSTIDAAGIAKLLGDRLPDVIAIVLTPEGTRLKDKDTPEIAEIFRESMDIETAVEVIDNFFGLNRIASAFEKLTGIMTQILPKKTAKLTGSDKSSWGLPAETSQKETGSSGGTPSGSASPGSKNAADGGSSGKA